MTSASRQSRQGWFTLPFLTDSAELRKQAHETRPFAASDHRRAAGAPGLSRAAAPLNLFSRDEQLAYWSNLYNITLVDEIVAIYPKRNLKKIVTGKNSILAQKVGPIFQQLFSRLQPGRQLGAGRQPFRPAADQVPAGNPGSRAARQRAEAGHRDGGGNGPGGGARRDRGI